MSERNGDKARFHRQRKERIKKRARMRAMQKARQETPAKAKPPQA